jgi:hypothetical protein
MTGNYICETCFDAMTNHVVDVRGFEEAVCDECIGGPSPEPIYVAGEFEELRLRNGSVIRFAPDPREPGGYISWVDEDTGEFVEFWGGIAGTERGQWRGQGGWRKRMGVEPTIAGISRDHWI